MHSAHSRTLRQQTIAAVCGGLALLVGCEDSSHREVNQAIAEARGQLQTLDSSRQVTAPVAYRESVYQQVASQLRPHATSVDGPEGSAVKLLLAEALAGQAAIASEQHQDQSIEALRLLTRGESVIDLYEGTTSLARALSGYDPAADIAELDRLATERTTEHARLSQDVAQREAQIQGLLDEAAQIKLLAEDKRREAGSLRSDALAADPSRRSSLIAQAHEIRRERERLYVDAERLETQAARFEPELAQARLELQRVDLQLQRLAAARDRTRNEATALSTESAEAQRDADEIAQQAAQSLESLVSFVQGDLAQSFASASSQYDEARSMASRVGREAPDEAKRAVISSMDLSRASLLRDQSDLVGRAAALLARAGSVSPSLPRSGEWASKAQELEQRAAELHEQSNEAYQATASAIRQGAGSGNRELAEQLAERLERLGGVSPEPPIPGEGDDSVPADDPIDADVVDESVDQEAGASDVAP